MAPLLEWWTGAVHRGARIVPWNFDISGFVDVSYVLFAFMLGAALGALVHRTGWAFAVGIPLYGVARLVVRNYLRPSLINGLQFQPGNNFWALQGAESAIFVGAALVLLGVTVLAVRRWRT